MNRMTPPAANNDQLDLSDALVMLGLPLVIPEPEVLKADLARIQCKTLARFITDLLTEHEPLLKAEADGATVTVSEIGGPMVMQFTVSPREGGRAKNLSASNK